MLVIVKRTVWKQRPWTATSNGKVEIAKTADMECTGTEFSSLDYQVNGENPGQETRKKSKKAATYVDEQGYNVVMKMQILKTTIEKYGESTSSITDLVAESFEDIWVGMPLFSCSVGL